MRTALATLSISLLLLAAALGDDGEKKADPKPTGPATPAPELDPAREADTLAFVRQHHPELATVLEALKPMNPAEYRKAIGDLSLVVRTLGDLKARNPRRHELALDAWKAKSRVELLAAQLAGAPSEDLRSQLRLAIEAKVEVDIRRQKFELEQAELAAKKARETLDRLEKNRDAVVEARFRALQPKKLAKKKAATAKPATVPANPKTNPNGEDRR